MIKNWKDIKYLQNGNNKQKHCYNLIKELKTIETLKDFNPVIAGTIPIEIDIETSDIDILCEVHNFDYFKKIILASYSNFKSFDIKEKVIKNIDCMIINFSFRETDIEIFAQSIPTELQDGFKHMLIEDRIIKIFGNNFKEKIIQLKKQGLKTEPAFGIILNINEDPYLELLKLYELSEENLKEYLAKKLHL